MDRKRLEEFLTEAVESLPQGAADPRVPGWVKKSLVGAGLSLSLFGCTGSAKAPSQPGPTANVYAGPPVMRVDPPTEATSPMKVVPRADPPADPPPSEETELPMR